MTDMDATTQNQPVIQVKDLVKQYSRTDSAAIKKINLEVKKGEFFGLIGPNGSGKTTLISILCGLLAPSSGKAMIGGHNVKSQFHDIGAMIGPF